MRESSKSFLLVGCIVITLSIVKCGGLPPIDPCVINPNLPGCPPTPIPPTTTTTTTTTTLPPATPHPICNLEVPRTVDCYHQPPGSGWLYACPLVNGVSINVPWGQENTCPSQPIPPPTPSPIPPGNVCSFPQGIPEPVYVFTASKPTAGMVEKVNAAVSSIGLCNVGSDCPLGTDPQVALKRIIAKLQLSGLCAGQDENGISDQLNVTADCKGGDGWDTYHSVKWPNNPGDQAKAVWASIPNQNCLGGRDAHGIPVNLGCPGVGGGSYRGRLDIPISLCQSPGPIPPIPPSPIPGNCPIPSPGDNWVYDLKPHAGQQLDLTPYVGNPTRIPNVPWPGCGVNRCPLSCEKGEIACTCQKILFGDPVWSTFSGTCNVFPPDPNSLMTVKVASGSCRLTVKGSAGSPIVGSWPVFAAVPACNVGSNGLCSQ